MVTQMGLYSHSDRMKHSLWIDPTKQSPPWPPCKHVNSLMKTRTRPQTSSAPVDGLAIPAPRTEDTVWQVYLAYILTGSIDTSLGEYKCWGPEDERDLEAERASHEKWVRAEEHRKGRSGSSWLSSILPWSNRRARL